MIKSLEMTNPKSILLLCVFNMSLLPQEPATQRNLRSGNPNEQESAYSPLSVHPSVSPLRFTPQE